MALGGAAAAVEKGLIGKAAPYLKNAGLYASEALEAGADMAESKIGKFAGSAIRAAPKVAGKTASVVGSNLLWGGEKIAGLAGGLGSKVLGAYAAYEAGTEFVKRAVYGSEEVKAQEQADGVASGYSKAVGIAGGAVATMWLGRRVSAGGLRTAATGVAKTLKDPESSLGKAVRSVDRVGGKVFGAVEEKAANVSGKVAQKFSNVEKAGLQDGDALGAKVARAGANVFSGAEGLFRSGGAANMEARAEALAARKAARAAGLGEAASGVGAKSTTAASKGAKDFAADIKKDPESLSRSADFVIDSAGTARASGPSVNLGGAGEKAREASRSLVPAGRDLENAKINLDIGSPSPNLKRLAAGLVLAGGTYVGYKHLTGEKEPNQVENGPPSMGRDSSVLGRGPAGNIESLGGAGDLSGSRPGAVLLTEGHLMPSTARQLASADNRMAMAARAMNFGDVSSSKSHTGYDVSEGSLDGNGRFFRVMRTDPGVAVGANREFAITVNAQGKGAMSETELKTSGSNSTVSKTVLADEPGLVSGKINKLTGTMVPDFGPKAAQVSSALGVLSRQDDPLSKMMEDAGKSGGKAVGHLLQTTGPEASQVMDFSVKKGNEVQNGKIELSNGFGRMVLMSPDGKDEVWSKQVPGIGVSMDTTGNVKLDGGVDKALGAFVKDPQGVARSLGPSNDPGRDVPAVAEGAVRPSDRQIAGGAKVRGEQILNTGGRNPGDEGLSSDSPARPSQSFAAGDQLAGLRSAANLSRDPSVNFGSEEVRIGAGKPGVEVSDANLSRAEKGLNRLLDRPLGVGGTVGGEVDSAIQDKRVVASELKRDALGPMGMRGTKEDSIFVGANGDRMEFGRFSGKDAMGNEGSFAGLMRMDASGKTANFTGTSEMDVKGVAVSRTVEASGYSVDNASAAGLASRVMGGSMHALLGRDDNLAEGLSGGALKNPKLQVLDQVETLRGGRPVVMGRQAEFSGLDENNNHVKGGVIERGGNITMLLYGPDGKTPEFRKEFDASEKVEARTAMRDFLQDPKGYEREHNAESQMGRPNAAMGASVGSSNPAVENAVRANAVFKASPALANWADMGQERYSPARGGNAEPIFSKSKEAAKDGGMGM